MTTQTFSITRNALPNRDELPRLSGIYTFTSSQDEVIYVGKALNLFNRVSSYFLTNAHEKQQHIVSESVKLSLIPTESEFTALLLESSLIKKHRPKFNIIHKDDKHYLYIKITRNDEFPKVSTCRREDDSRSLYFGPFPRTETVRETLRMLRRIFPFCQQKQVGIRACFYAHLGLCNPCPGTIIQKTGEARDVLKQQYRQSIFRLIRVLEGKHAHVLKDLKKEMEEFSRKDRFEDAHEIKMKISRLEAITTHQYQINHYLENPAFLDETHQKEIEDLQSMLRPHFPRLSSLARIECFDISNLLGRDAVGSMTVLINGTQAREEYRRFRIKTVTGANDPAMIGEVVMRRIKHFDDWGKPDLIIVDGGKTQVSAAYDVLYRHDSIPFIGLAKRLEQIVIFDGTTFEILSFSLTRPGLNVLRRIRDEAHRFAISYHKKLRGKRFLGKK